MNLKNIFIAAGVLGLLAACQSTSEGGTMKNTQGQVLGKRDFKVISPQDSDIQVNGDDSMIVRREANRLPSRYQERWQIQGGGVIFYETLYESFFDPAQESDEMLVKEGGPQLAKLGLPFSIKDVKSIRFQKDRLYYVHKADAHRSCFLFDAFLGDASYGKGSSHLEGGACHFKNNSPFGSDMEAGMLRLLKSLRF